MDQKLTAVSLAQRLIAFKTANPPGNERTAAEYLAGLLESGGFAVALAGPDPERPNLIARLDGDHPLCFTGHLDTVPAGDSAWSVDPFAGKIKSGRLYGRGASDMKAGVAAMVSAGLRIADLPRGGRGFLLVLTADEEPGCLGALQAAPSLKTHGRAGALVVGEPSGNYPLLGHKGVLRVEIETSGVAAHASTPQQGDNAIFRAARLVTGLQEFDFRAPDHPALGGMTLNVGTIRGGVNINTVPDRTVLGVDIRTVMTRSHADVLSDLRVFIGEKSEMTVLTDLDGFWTDPAQDWIQQVFDIAEPFLGERPSPRAAPYMTDASVLGPALGDPPAIVLGPGDIHQAHAVDEYCELKKIGEAAEIYFEIARQWCQGHGA